MILAHKIRINPSPEQETYFNQASGIKRFVYNWGLDFWKSSQLNWIAPLKKQLEGYVGEKTVTITLPRVTPKSINDIKKEFNSIKQYQYPWVYNVAKDVVEGAFQDLGTALKNYFDFKNSKRKSWIGFPKFKARKRSKQSFRLNNDKIKVVDNLLYVPRLGYVNMTETLRLSGKVMGVVISKTASWWFAAIYVEVTIPDPVSFKQESVGVDLGLKTLAKLSDNEQFENQKLFRKELRKLKKLNRELSRKIKGSSRWYRVKKQLARFHYKVACKRKDLIHKMTTTIASKYRIIGVEDLNAEGMKRNRRLSLSISDASFGEIIRQLVYKSLLFGSQVIKVGRFFPSSKLCSDCGFRNPDLELSDRIWTCPNCNETHDRDLNAAINIEREAMRLVSS